MSKPRKLGPIIAFIGWIVGALLVVWLFIVVRDAALNLIDTYYVGESVWRARQLETLDKFYALIGSAVGVFLIAAGGAYFQKVGNEPDVFRKLARILGIELLVLALFHGILLALQGSGGGWQRFLFFGLELSIGLAFLGYAFLARMHAPPD